MKVVSALEAPTLSDPVGITTPPTEAPAPEGKLSSTVGGIVKLPSEMRVSQWKEATTGLLPSSMKLLPSMLTKLVGSPPLQVMVCPALRSTVFTLAWLVQTSACGTFNLAVNGPTSAPPGPVIV